MDDRLICGHYQLLEQIGAGGMGEVYLARDTRLDRRVALKFLPSRLSNDAKARERLLREAKAASRISHPNILTIHEVGEDENGNVFIAMQYVEGTPLSELIKNGPLPIERAVAIARQVCDGLARAHESHVVHRDIKPDNIVIDRDGNATILDFGLARLMDASALTRSGTMIGTIQYMSPEQARGEPVDARSDIFSLGAVIYEMVTGISPFEGENPASIINKILNEPVEPPSRVCDRCPPGMDAVIAQALDKDAEARYASVRALSADLERVSAGHSILLPRARRQPSPSAPTVGRVSGWRRYGLPTIAVAIVALFAVVINPWQLQFLSQRQASASANSLAVMYFDNIGDTAEGDQTPEMITSLLITNLSQTPSLKVVSRQHLNDLLQRYQAESPSSYTSALTAKVAEMAGAHWLLTGSIVRTQPAYVLVSNVSEVESGKIVASQRVEGSAGEDLISVVDRLGSRILADIAPEATADAHGRLADMTTGSTKSYSAYLEGMDALSRVDYPSALTAFKRATQIDSNFAAAFCQLARTAQSLAMYPEGQRAIDRAYALIHRATVKDSLYIESYRAQFAGSVERALSTMQEVVNRFPDEKDAVFTLGLLCQRLNRYDDAVAWFKRVIALDSTYKLAYNNLAYAYYDRGDQDKSIEAINAYIALAPDECNPYDSRGELYAMSGQVEPAIASYRKALERQPNFVHALVNLGHLYLFKRDYARADSLYQEVFRSEIPETRAYARQFLAYIPLYQGDLRGALDVLRKGLSADAMENIGPYQLAEKHMLMADVYNALDRSDSALTEMYDASRLLAQSAVPAGDFGRSRVIEVLAKSGHLMGAHDSLSALEASFASRPMADRVPLEYATGCVQRADGDLDGALSSFKQAADSKSYLAQCELAATYLKAGELGSAVNLLEKLTRRRCDYRAFFILASARAEFQLAQAYELSGWQDEALRQYARVHELWGGTQIRFADANVSASDLTAAR